MEKCILITFWDYLHFHKKYIFNVFFCEESSIQLIIYIYLEQLYEQYLFIINNTFWFYKCFFLKPNNGKIVKFNSYIFRFHNANLNLRKENFWQAIIKGYCKQLMTVFIFLDTILKDTNILAPCYHYIIK